jgi:hypothetical protein
MARLKKKNRRLEKQISQSPEAGCPDSGPTSCCGQITSCSRKGERKRASSETESGRREAEEGRS